MKNVRESQANKYYMKLNFGYENLDKHSLHDYI